MRQKELFSTASFLQQASRKQALQRVFRLSHTHLDTHSDLSDYIRVYGIQDGERCWRCGIQNTNGNHAKLITLRFSADTRLHRGAFAPHPIDMCDEKVAALSPRACFGAPHQHTANLAFLAPSCYPWAWNTEAADPFSWSSSENRLTRMLLPTILIADISGPAIARCLEE